MSKTHNKEIKKYNDRNPFVLEARKRKHGAHKNKRNQFNKNWREWDVEEIDLLLADVDDDLLNDEL